MKLSVIVPFNKFEWGLVNTLSMLQHGTVIPDRIIIVDSSPRKKGLAISRMFHLPGVEMLTQVTKATVYESWNCGLDFVEDHHTLIINDDIVFSRNFIAEMKDCAMQNEALVYVPHTPPRSFSSSQIQVNFYDGAEYLVEDTEWMPGFAFMLSPECVKNVGKFDENYKVWFGDTDYENKVKKYANSIGKKAIIKAGTYAYHFGGFSHRYQSQEVLDIITEDRKRFYKLNK